MIHRSCWTMALGVWLAQGGTLHAVDDGQVLKERVRGESSGPNLLVPEAWGPWRDGFDRTDAGFRCDNGADATAHRGVSQTLQLNQAEPAPIVASVWSRAEDVSGSPDSDYALYLDLIYTDGTPLWGQSAPFHTGTHDWERREVVVFPEKPVRSVSMHLLLRRHAGRAHFRNPAFRVLDAGEGAVLFDGVPVRPVAPPQAGFQLRDVAADSGFVALQREALGLGLTVEESAVDGGHMLDVTLRDTTGTDRAVTLVYTLPAGARQGRWLRDPRQSEPVNPPREYLLASRFRAGSNGRLGRYPFAAVDTGSQGLALGIDPAYPAFFRCGYHAGTDELFVAFDLGLTPEQPRARLRICRFDFDPDWGFRAALERYYHLLPEAFTRRVEQQGLWMPFAKISAVPNHEDFGFRIKEGRNETAWDDAHDILTFRYTEPMTWWMAMPPERPRTPAAARALAREMAATGNPQAQAWQTSAYHDESGAVPLRLLDTPWCKGAVWSMNSMPGIPGAVTDFKQKWNPELRQDLYGPEAVDQLDGEYIDSCEGYVTDELDFRRAHFAAVDTPLTFSTDTHRPAIFRGLVAFEYIRAIARDAHGMNRLTMANGAPGRLCWLPPLLDVLGTETDWNPGGVWRPMGDDELLYRRALSRGKPFCFLMNTVFEQFPTERVDRYMQRCLAYGMFPGFFSHNASEGHYFSRPELYERDRNLFKKYLPLCRAVAEAGWAPVTGVRTDTDAVTVERFGTRFLTVFNQATEPRSATLLLEREPPGACHDRVSGQTVDWNDRRAVLRLDAESVAVLEWTKP